MTTDVTLPQSFQEKISEKLKDSIADLLSEEELKRLVEAGITQHLFNRRPDRYHGDQLSVAEAILKQLAGPRLEAELHLQLADWMKANDEYVKSLVTDAIQKGAGELMLRAFSNALECSMISMFENFRNNLMRN